MSARLSVGSLEDIVAFTRGGVVLLLLRVGWLGKARLGYGLEMRVGALHVGGVRDVVDGRRAGEHGILGVAKRRGDRLDPRGMRVRGEGTGRLSFIILRSQRDPEARRGKASSIG